MSDEEKKVAVAQPATAPAPAAVNAAPVAAQPTMAQVVRDPNAPIMLEGKDVVIRVFNMDDPANFEKVLTGQDIGTVICKE